MKKTQRAWIALFLCIVMLLTLGCAARASSEKAAYAPQPESAAYDYATVESADEAGYAASTSASGATVSQGEQPGDFDVRKIVYTANMSITADDPASALETLVSKAESLGGYLSGSYTTTDDFGADYASATIKVPADQLEALVSAANELGKVDDYRLSSDDISLSYYDMQARLDNAKAEEEQLLEILAKCETVEDILAVRESLTGVRADIESYTAQMNLWDNLVAYATLSVTIDRTPQTAVQGEKELISIWKASDVWGRMTKGFQNSARFMVNAIGAIGIFIAIAIIPAGVLFLAIGLPIIAHRKKKRQKVALEKEKSVSKPEPDDTTKLNE